MISDLRTRGNGRDLVVENSINRHFLMKEQGIVDRITERPLPRSLPRQRLDWACYANEISYKVDLQPPNTLFSS
ncbi:hypothetical protein HZ326_10209 [Fusarium oxysporum f. sp. albedinis]|nr:hypothetical protein HZ326_10209 [Fusarium oxysporum f. sp. albedinis]